MRCSADSAGKRSGPAAWTLPSSATLCGTHRGLLVTADSCFSEHDDITWPDRWKFDEMHAQDETFNVGNNPKHAPRVPTTSPIRLGGDLERLRSAKARLGLYHCF